MTHSHDGVQRIDAKRLQEALQQHRPFDISLMAPQASGMKRPLSSRMNRNTNTALSRKKSGNSLLPMRSKKQDE